MKQETRIEEIAERIAKRFIGSGDNIELRRARCKAAIVKALRNEREACAKVADERAAFNRRLMRSEKHDMKRRSPAMAPCETCGKDVTTGGAGRKQHMKTHQRPAMPDRAARARFEKLFTKLKNECWQWGAVSAKSPYGSFHFAGRNYMAFIFSWWLYRGELIKTPPDHLEPVTRSENARRAQKPHCPKGHAYTPENTRYSKTGHRICVVCGKAKNKEFYEANKERLNARDRAKRAEQRRPAAIR